MALTTEQALQQGLAAQEGGELEEAERLYHGVLQSEPKHPDANHNLGLIAVSLNKVDVALPLFKTALEANPQKEQFWVSYIDALIKEKQFDSAKKVLDRGKKAGWTGEKVDALEEQLRPIVQAAGPSDAEINNLSLHYQNGQFDEAEKLALSFTERFPTHVYGWKILGATLKQTGRSQESLVPLQKVATLSPGDAAAHSNLGVVLKELERLEEAEASYRQAIALKPDYPAAHNNLGMTLTELGRLDEAEATCRQAIALKPDYAEAHYNLGNVLQEQDRFKEAEASYRQAIAFKPDFAEAHSNLGVVLNELDRLDEAERSYKQAIALMPDFVEAHYNLGVMLQTIGRHQEALDALVVGSGFISFDLSNGLTII